MPFWNAASGRGRSAPSGVRSYRDTRRGFALGGWKPVSFIPNGSKMRSIADRMHTVDSLRVAVLAALNIADERKPGKGDERIDPPVCSRAELCDQPLSSVSRKRCPQVRSKKYEKPEYEKSH